MVLGAASRRPLSAVSANRSVAELPRALKFEKKGKRVAKAEGGGMPVGDNLAGKGGEKKETALAGTAGADAEPAPECECGEEAKLTCAKKASGETRFYWLCSKDQDACNFFMPCAAAAAAAAVVQTTTESVKQDTTDDARKEASSSAASGKESAVQGKPAERFETRVTTEEGVDEDSLGVAMSSMSQLTLGARESGRSEDTSSGGKRGAASSRPGRAEGDENGGTPPPRETAATNTTTTSAAAPAVAVSVPAQHAPHHHRDSASKGREEADLCPADQGRERWEEKRRGAGKTSPSAGEIVLAGVSRRDAAAPAVASSVSAAADERLKNVLIDDDEALSSNWREPRDSKPVGNRVADSSTRGVSLVPGVDLELVKAACETLWRRPRPTSFVAPDGLCTELMRHQVEGVSWMVEREGGGGPLGGILADDMGLGKTVQVIALILKNPKGEKKRGGRCTLVVCPKSTIHQWLCELSRLAPDLDVLDYSGPGRGKGIANLNDYDVAVASYSVVTRDHQVQGEQGAAAECKGGARVEQANRGGALYNSRFRRIVLDEGHTVTNVSTKGFRAVCDLEGKRRWVVTGTPVQNKPEEMLAYFRFVGISPFDDARIFRRTFMENPAKGTLRLQAMSNALILRRTKASVFGGVGQEGSTTMPRRTVKVVEVQLSDDELALSKGFESLSRQWVLSNAAGSRARGECTYTDLLTLLLRAQQACNNPMLIPLEARDKALAAPSHAPQVGKAERGRGGLGSRPGPRPKKMHSVECGEEEGGGGKREEGGDDEAQGQVVEADGEDGVGDLLEDLTASLAGVSIGQKGPGERKECLESSKLAMLVRDIDLILRDDPLIKSVVFSQWTQQLDAASSALMDAGINHVRLDGDMTSSKRQESINSFQEDEDVKVFLVSLKAGGAGLNLTRGSRVYMLDPWWNPAVENQAYDRVHRLGQTREVTITRYIAKESMEERVLELQARKQRMADAMLGSSAKGNSGDRITFKDLLTLLP